MLVLLRWPSGTPRAAAFDWGPPNRQTESEVAYSLYKTSLERTWANVKNREIPLKAWGPAGTAGTSCAEAATGSVAILLLEMRDILHVDK